MKKTAILIFVCGNLWWFVGWYLHHLLWPHDLCSHWPNQYVSWLLGTTTFADGVSGNLFWGFFQLSMFCAGAIAIGSPDKKILAAD